MDERQPQRRDTATDDAGMGLEEGGTESQGNMTVASLRRSNAQLNPTRTLALLEAEQSSRESTPVRVSIESLSRRPRSNPRSRTPMRYESPLDPDEFRRESLEPEESSAPPANEGRRITIRPLAGSAVGTAPVHRVSVGSFLFLLSMHFSFLYVSMCLSVCILLIVFFTSVPLFFDYRKINEERPRSTVRSRKQGPSCRKIRRWNNEKFSSLAAEIKASSAGGGAAAEAILRAQDEAHLYRAVYDPKDHRSETLSR
jgi:hypothetical protein